MAKSNSSVLFAYILLLNGTFLTSGCGTDEAVNDDGSGTDSEAGDSDGDSETGDDGDTGDPGDDSDSGRCDGVFAAAPMVEDSFDGDWEETQTLWRRASWTQNGTQMSPERCVTNDEGFLEQTVLAGTPFQGGSMQSADEYGYGRWVARLKPSSVPGVLNSMFTMDWDDLTTDGTDGDGSHEEVDIEFLTYTFGDESGEVHFAVHRPEHSNYVSEDIPLDFNPSDDFHEWGFDILPDRVNWHVDGEILHTFMYDDTVNLVGRYEMFFNSWTRESWINGPPAEDAVYQIDWVRFYPYDEACDR